VPRRPKKKALPANNNVKAISDNAKALWNKTTEELVDFIDEMPGGLP
jgi:hypothetical protein